MAVAPYNSYDLTQNEREEIRELEGIRTKTQVSWEFNIPHHVIIALWELEQESITS